MQIRNTFVVFLLRVANKITDGRYKWIKLAEGYALPEIFFMMTFANVG